MEEEIKNIPIRFTKEQIELLKWGSKATERNISSYIRWSAIRFTKMLKGSNVDIDINKIL